MALLKIVLHHEVLRAESFVDPRGEQIINLTEDELKRIAAEYVNYGACADVRIIYTGNRW